MASPTHVAHCSLENSPRVDWHLYLEGIPFLLFFSKTNWSFSSTSLNPTLQPLQTQESPVLTAVHPWHLSLSITIHFSASSFTVSVPGRRNSNLVEWLWLNEWLWILYIFLTSPFPFNIILWETGRQLQKVYQIWKAQVYKPSYMRGWDRMV